MALLKKAEPLQKKCVECKTVGEEKQRKSEEMVDLFSIKHIFVQLFLQTCSFYKTCFFETFFDKCFLLILQNSMLQGLNIYAI